MQEKMSEEEKPIKVKSSSRISRHGTPSWIKPHRRKKPKRRIPIIINPIPEDFVRKVPHGKRR